VVIFTSCSKDDETPDETQIEASELTQKVNKFMKVAMEDIYLWYDELPDVDYKYVTDSYEYFDTLLYVDDKWSFATDDVDALEDSFEGIEKSYGWSLAFGLFSNTGNVFAIVEYVYPNTPAADADVQRGDIIVLMDDDDITVDNYTDLLYGETISITYGILEDGSISTGSTISLTAEELTLNPVVKTSVVEQGDHKIGYLLYAQYISGYNDALDTAFQSMINKGVTDLVLDLRYNPGGTITAATHMCSCIAPLSTVNSNSTLVTYQWNDKYQSYFTDNQIMSQLEVYFDNQVDVKMGLNNIHILTGSGTASASELTITGLMPYMSVTTVGETTYGKYTASITLKPEDYYTSESYYSEFDNWGIQPIVIRYANSIGVTDFVDGFSPDIEVEDDLFATLPLGTKEEPLFKAAIEDITGTEVVAIKSAKKIDFSYTIFDRGFSKFDENKRELLIDNFDLNTLK
jgi:C-terminal processing protease CtpA/Prc